MKKTNYMCSHRKRKEHLNNYLRMMKLSVFFLVTSAFSVFAGNSYSQYAKVNVNIQQKEAELESIFREIEKQTNFLFIYNNQINVNRKVDVHARNEELSLVLNKLFKDMDINYSISDSHIILTNYRQQESKQEEMVEISGTVVLASDNQPAPGVTVAVGGTSIGTTTDFDGNYRLQVPASTKEITFSFLGHRTKKINMKDRILLKVVVLEESTELLDEVVVVGFGTQKKESLVGAVQAIKPGELKITSSNLTTSFAGRIAGVIATQASGEPGADGASFWIRGISTFGTNSSPLIILDGVEIVSEMLNSIAPETIESFSVLKDATATALYGSRGANGVLIITTKTGSSLDKININVRVQAGISTPTKIQDIADGITYMKKYNEAVGHDYYSSEKIENTLMGNDKYLYPNNNWHDLMFKDFTFNQNANINVSGGSKKLDYFLNAAIHNENGILKDQPDFGYSTNIGLQRYTFQSNVSTLITPTTRVGVKMNTILQYNHRPYESIGNLFYYAMRANPVMFPVTFPAQAGDDFVRFGNAPSWDGGANDVNPVALMSRGYADRYLSYLTTVFNADQDLKFVTPGLKARFQVSFYNKTYAATSRYSTPYYFWLNESDPYTTDEYGNEIYNMSSIGPAGTKYLSTSTGRDGHREYTLQGAVEYNRKFNDLHDINTLIVYHQKERVYNTPDADEYAVLPYREQGIAGRITYGYDSRYLFEANFGYNGSENFLPKRRWGFFPSIAVGWNISNEAFFQELSDKISLLKVRASWGKSGNDALANRFPYLTTVLTGQNLYFYYGRDIQRAEGATIKTMGNEEATWETSTKTNLGLEVGLFHNLTLIMDFFTDKRSDIFMSRRSIPTSAGYSGSLPYANLGKVKNQGFDASLEYNKAFSKDFILSLRGTFTYAHNEVVAKDEPALLYPYTSQIGHPINTIYGLVADGIFSDWDEIKNSPVQNFEKDKIAPGDIKYVDLNGDNVIDANDVTAIGYPTRPEIMYGFGPSVKYKNWDFSFFFQGTTRVSLIMSNMHPFVSASYSGFGMTQWVADEHWTASNPDPQANYPRLSATWNSNNTQKSSYWVRDASFLRLKSAEVGWTYKRARVYISGTNLLTFSGFKYWDPELGGGDGLSYPLQRTATIGCQFNF